MKIIDTGNKLTMGQLAEMASLTFGDLVKAVVDVKREVMAVDAELHADEEALLLESGSSQENLWGINLYPDLAGNDFIEFDSMINLRPSQKNLSRGVDDEDLRRRINAVVTKLITR